MKKVIIPIIILFIIISSNIGKKDSNVKTNNKENSQNSNQQNQNLNSTQSLKPINNNMISETSKSNNTQLKTKTTIEYLKNKNQEIYMMKYLFIRLVKNPILRKLRNFVLSKNQLSRMDLFTYLCFLTKKRMQSFLLIL